MEDKAQGEHQEEEKKPATNKRKMVLGRYTYGLVFGQFMQHGNM